MPHSRSLRIPLALLVMYPGAIATAQGTLADYRRAERFLPASADTLASRTSITPRWIRDGDRFWYRNSASGRFDYVFVDPAANIRRPLFDHARLASALSAATGRTLRPDSLPVDSLAFTERLDSVEVIMARSAARCSLVSYACVSATIDTLARQPGRSPDGRWVAFVRDFNLWVREAATGAERQLTTDGIRDWAYASPVTSITSMLQQNTETPRENPRVAWSPDSKRFMTYRTDTRRAGKLTMTQFVPPTGTGTRPRSFTYAYPLAGDSVLPTAAPTIFVVDGWRRLDVAMPPIEHMSYGGGPGFLWTRDGKRVFTGGVARDYSAARLWEIDPVTGRTRLVHEERGDPYIDNYFSVDWWLDIVGRNVLLWSSPRDGWNHLYAHDVATGALTRQLTSGSWVFYGVSAIDTVRNVVFFDGLGREPSRDPYLSHVYRVDLNGSSPVRLLTPEPAHHVATFSPSRRYFIDTYSRVDLPPVTVLRRASDGTVIRELERADVSRLTAIGWQPPEQFKVLARDGTTELYGVIWKPTNFDASRKYPIIEQVYTGPHSFFTPKAFTGAYRNAAQGMAELGFVVVMLDGMGTAGRSKAFHDVSYRNLGGGTADHPGAIRQLAATRPYMDTTRVGIYGHSAGAYDAAHAMLVFPDFYKVGVASAGDHDARLDKAVWNAQWMGYELGDHYREQANPTLARNLKGKLLLAHGDIDDNVPMVTTIQFADALIRENRDFDLLIVPGATHALGGHPYFMRRRWDYFVRHLLGVEPPRDYRIGR